MASPFLLFFFRIKLHNSVSALEIMVIRIKNLRIQIIFNAGPEGLEPSTNCSAGSHSIQAELWARSFLRIANHI